MGGWGGRLCGWLRVVGVGWCRCRCLEQGQREIRTCQRFPGFGPFPMCMPAPTVWRVFVLMLVKVRVRVGMSVPVSIPWSVLLLLLVGLRAAEVVVAANHPALGRGQTWQGMVFRRWRRFQSKPWRGDRRASLAAG